MLHPFLILPLVGIFTLGKIIINTEQTSSTVLTVMVFMMFGVMYYMFNNVKPFRPMRKNMEFWGANIGDFMDHVQIRNPDPDPVPVDQARIVFDIFDLRNNNGLGGFVNILNTDKNTDVHNHQIQESLRESIIQLIDWYDNVPHTERLSEDETYHSIKEYLFGDYNDKLDKKEKVYSTVRHMQKTNGLLSSVNRTESDILKMVWCRINAPINKKARDQLRNNLLDLLADSAIRIDSSYCLVGRITRMVQALQSFDQEGLVDIKCLDTINKEIQAKIPVLRDDFFNAHPTLLPSYEKGDDLVANQLVEFVQEKVYKDYPQAIIDDEIRTIIDKHVAELY